MSAGYEPAIGDTVGVELDEMPHAGEVVQLLAGATVGVRITDLDCAYYGQVVYFNSGLLSPVSFRRVQ